MEELEKRIKEMEAALELQSSINNATLETNETLYEMILNVSNRIDIVQKGLDGGLDIMSKIVTNNIVN